MEQMEYKVRKEKKVSRVIKVSKALLEHEV